MDYKGSDSPPPYQKLSSEPVSQTVQSPQPVYQAVSSPQPVYQAVSSPQPVYQTVVSTQPGYQAVSSPQLAYQAMSSPQPGYQTIPSPLPIVLRPALVFRDTPVHMNCSNCGRAVFSSISKKNGICAYIAAVAVLILFCPCFWIPLVVDSCKDVNHTCPVCGALLGRYKQL